MWGRNRVGTRNFLIGIAILAASISIYFLWKERVFDHFTPARIESFLSRFGNFAPLVYILLLAVAIVISQIPNVPLAIAAGMLFGTFRGGLYSLVGGMLGATACFFIARFLGISFIRKIFGMIPMTFLFTRMGGLIMDQSYLPLLFNGTILIVFLLAPLIVRKYNPFGLNEYITFK